MNNMTETTAFGEAFLRDWYRKIDGKAPFSELARLTVGEGLVVDFPNNPLDLLTIIRTRNGNHFW